MGKINCFQDPYCWLSSIMTHITQEAAKMMVLKNLYYLQNTFNIKKIEKL